MLQIHDMEKKLPPERQIRVKYPSVMLYQKCTTKGRGRLLSVLEMVCHGLQRRSPIVHPFKKRKQLLVYSLWNSVGFRFSKIPD